MNKDKLTFGILISISIILIFTMAAHSAENTKNMDERMELIEASQNMSIERAEESIKYNKNKFSVFVTNYGSNNTVNPGAKFDIQVYENPNFDLSLVPEAIFLNDEDTTAFYTSLKAKKYFKNIAPYLGAGVDLSDSSQYQVFAGTDITENVFAEAKYIEPEEEIDDSDVFFSIGYQMGF